MASDRGPTAAAPEAQHATPVLPHAALANPLKRARDTDSDEPGLVEAGALSPSKIARLESHASEPELEQQQQQQLQQQHGLREGEHDQRHQHQHHQDQVQQQQEQQGHQHQDQEQQQGHQQNYNHLLAQNSETSDATEKALEELMMSTEPSAVGPQNVDASVSGPASNIDQIKAAAAAAARALSSVNTSAGHNTEADTNTNGTSLEEAGGHVVHSPVAMEGDSQSLFSQQPDAQIDDKTGPGTSLTYPGVIPSEPAMGAPPSRGMSMPMPGPQSTELGPRSPGSKRHKCPYCETEFTRQHNLKSHMLTHSHEKPYLCQACNMRFRRLHDLKRHSKLHTGEKPHICPKCDRKFARGDALARHSKGAGGCAGRRASMQFLGGEDDFEGASGADDSAMSGVAFEGSPEADGMTEEERRRLSLPSIKAQHVAGPEGHTATHSNTYPPVGQRSNVGGGLFPPNLDRGSVSTTTSPSLATNHTPHTSISSVPLSAGSSSMYSQSGISESPKPLSPGTTHPGQAPAHFRQQDQAGVGLALPQHGTVHIAPAPVPPAPAHQQPAGRGGRGRAATGTAPPPAPLPAPLSTTATAGNGAEPAPNGVVSETDVWTYFRLLDDRMKTLQGSLDAEIKAKVQLSERVEAQDRQIAGLRAEIVALRQQIATSVAAAATSAAPTLPIGDSSTSTPVAVP